MMPSWVGRDAPPAPEPPLYILLLRPFLGTAEQVACLISYVKRRGMYYSWMTFI